ncbi:MAG: ABC transporter permease, partial [Leptospiraceae bacterium]|nr:ABC transporter permease [Leptospiraceae bacterium]
MWLALLKKEIYLLGRAKNGLLSILSLCLSALFLFYFGFEDRNSLDVLQITATKWVILFLIIHTLVGQSIWEERESDAYR